MKLKSSIFRRPVRLTALVVLLVITSFVVVRAWRFTQVFLDSLRPKVERALTEVLGLTVEISDLNFAFFPLLGLSASNISLISDESCTAAIKADKIILRFDYAALLRRELRVSMIKIDSPAAEISLTAGKITWGQSPLTSLPISDSDKPSCPVRKPLQSNLKADDNAHKKEVASGPFYFSVAIEAIAITNAKLKVHQPGSMQELILNEFTADLHLSNNILNISSPSVDGLLDQAPIDFKALLVKVNTKTKLIQIKDAELNLGKLHLKCSGALQDWFRPRSLQLSSRLIDIKQLVSLLDIYYSSLNLPHFKDGQLTFALNLSTARKGGAVIDGQISLTNIDMPSLELKLSKFGLKQFQLELERDSKWSFDTSFDLRDFKIKDRVDSYQLASGSGKFVLTRDETGRLGGNGNLEAKAFGFNDGTTKITNADATLSKIDTVVSPKGDVLVTVDLSGQDLDLDHERVTIRGFSDLVASLEINVPAQGGYSVSGPVSIDKANITTLKRNFKAVSGNVQMLVSKPLKHFVSNNITAQLMGQNLSLETDFSMKKEAYLFKSTSLKIPPAILDVSGILERNSGRAFSFELSGQNLEPAELASLIQPGEKTDFQGMIKSLNLNLSGDMHSPVDSLSGQGDILVTEPLSKEFNLSVSIANAISKLPVIGNTIVPNHLKEDDSEQSAQATFTVAKRQIHTSDLLIKRDRFTLYGQGNIDFDFEVDAKASVVFLRETFGGFGGDFEPFSTLLGRLGKIEIPLFVQGTFPDLALTPDTVTFVKDNSGLTLLHEALGTTKDIGTGMGKIITSPFRREKTPEIAPTIISE